MYNARRPVQPVGQSVRSHVSRDTSGAFPPLFPPRTGLRVSDATSKPLQATRLPLPPACQFQSQFQLQIVSHRPILPHQGHRLKSFPHQIYTVLALHIECSLMRAHPEHPLPLKQTSSRPRSPQLQSPPASTPCAGTASATRCGPRTCRTQARPGRVTRRASRRCRCGAGSAGRAAALSGGSWRTTRGGRKWGPRDAGAVCGRFLQAGVSATCGVGVEGGREGEFGDAREGVLRLPRKRIMGWRACWRRVLVAFIFCVAIAVFVWGGAEVWVSRCDFGGRADENL